MRVNKPTEVSNLVRADSKKASNGFRYVFLGGDEYAVPVKDNPSVLYIRRAIKEEQSIFIEPDYVLVFNIKNNCMGIIKAGQMVEPVDLTVNVEGKQL